MTVAPSLLLGLVAALVALLVAGDRLRRCVAALVVLGLPAAAFEALGWRLGAGGTLPPATAGFHLVNALLVMLAAMLAVSARHRSESGSSTPHAAPTSTQFALGIGAWLITMVVPWVHVPFALGAGLLLASTMRRASGVAGLVAAAADGLAGLGLLWGWWLVATIAPGTTIPMLAEAPFSPAAEVLLGGLVGLGGVRLAGGLPLPQPAIGLVGAGLGAALLTRVVAEPMPLATAHWGPGWALGLALGAAAGAATGRPARVMACLGGLGVVLQGTGFTAGWVLLLAGLLWPVLAPRAAQPAPRALAAGILAWAGVATLAGTMQVETVYGVVTWLAASWAALVPSRPRPVATG